jgi:DNA helicase-2/ATP-dependent DNA helicase PcrA
MEMKERVIKLVGEKQGKKLFCNTFHAFAVDVLKMWGKRLGIDDNFTIHDQADREALLQKIIQELGGRTTLKKVLHRFDNCVDVREERTNFPEECRVLEEYGYRLRQNNAVDLDRLVDLVNKLWMENSDVLEFYQSQYPYVFVDEFQDTSDEQMEMIRIFNPDNLFVVGDDYQAIYGWRKARVEYIIDFPKWYPSCEVIKLEDNYRSTNQIIAAANSLIRHNIKQTRKSLIAHKDGFPVITINASDEYGEARTIGNMIKELAETGKPYIDIAVLARTNKQIDMCACILEEMGIPVQRVTGGDDIFKRGSVRWILDWIDFVYNKRDMVALKKALAFSTARVNELQMQLLELESLENDLSLYDAMELHRDDQNHFARKFMELVDSIHRSIDLEDKFPVSEVFLRICSCLNGSVHGDAETALSYIRSWEQTKIEMGEDYSAQSFIKWLKFRDVHEKLVEEKQAVKLMTIHASKGLEFDTVFVAGMNQGVFPSKRTSDPDEERRLCYVALTRAKERLLLTRSETTSDWHGNKMVTMASQYLDEMTASN